MSGSFKQINTLVNHVVVSTQSAFSPYLQYLVSGSLNGTGEFIELTQSMSLNIQLRARCKERTWETNQKEERKG